DGHAIRAEFNLGSAPVVVSVARFAANRKHDLLLAGFGRLLDKLPEARLLLVGKGERRGGLEQLVTELGLERRVIFTGYRDPELPQAAAPATCLATIAARVDED